MLIFAVMKRICGIAALVMLALLAGCGKQRPDEYRQLDDETRAQRKYVNLFAYNVMDAYYLWKDEIKADLEKWENWEEPIQKVADLRYKDRSGKDIDRWTLLTDDFSSFQGGVSGHTRTLGMDFQLYYTDKTQTGICAVVTYTYAGSPAEAAGLRRGDVILTIDGSKMTPDNYQQLVRNGLLGGGTVKLGLSDGKTVTLTAVDMYENPVQTVRILENGAGKKVGYLHYTSFTLDSCEELSEVFRHFVSEGINDLVLDLRYNGGGYVTAEEVLASMLVPVKEVEAESVFTRQVYNSELAKKMSDEPSRFKTGFTFRSNGSQQIVSTAGANPDLPRLFVLVTESSASASECLVCGLRPYMDVRLIGGKTGGKYCAGYIIDATDWFDSVKEALDDGEYEKALPYVDNWGIYVMYARYADCNGNTLSMPDGIAPDVEADDDPTDGFELGDPQESMLSEALGLIEGRTRASEHPSRPRLTPIEGDFHPRTTGILIGRY